MKHAPRRITILLISLIALSMPLYAQSWEAVGIGSTEQEAKDNAYINLLQMVSGVNITENTSIMVRDDGSVENQNILRENATLTTHGYLFGVKNEFKGNGKTIEDHVTLNESAIPIYRSRISQLVKDIEASYATNPTDDKTRKDRYLNLLNLLYQYENQRHIVSILDADMTTIPEIDLNITYNTIQNEYMGYLIENENRYSQSLNEMNEFGTAEFTDLQQKLIETKQAQAEIQANVQLAQVEHDLMQKKRVEESMNRYVEHVVLPSSVPDLEDQNDFWNAFVDVLEETFNFKMKYERTIKAEQDRINNEIYVTSESMRRMPYRISEQNNGKPLLSAVIFRNLEIEKMTNEKKAELAELIALIDEKMNPVLETMYERIELMSNDFMARTYIMTTNDVLIQASYDGAAKNWNFNISGRVGTLKPQITCSMSYQSVTGRKPLDTASYSPIDLAQKIASDANFRDAYEEESQIVNSYTTGLITNVPDIMINYHYDKDTDGCFIMVIDKATIDFLDGNGNHEIDVKSISIANNRKKLVDNWYEILNTSMFRKGNRKLPSDMAFIENAIAYPRNKK